MSPSPDSTNLSAQEYEVLQNRIDVAIATQKRLVRGWMEDMYTKAGKELPPEKSEEELAKEDVEFLNFWEPPHLGLGAPIPKEYYNERGELIRKEMTSMEKLATIPDLKPVVMRIQEKERLLAGKQKPARDKSSSLKRTHKQESSDEEEGRSALGKRKKVKSSLTNPLSTPRDIDTQASGSFTMMKTQSFITAKTQEDNSKRAGSPVSDIPGISRQPALARDFPIASSTDSGLSKVNFETPPASSVKQRDASLVDGTTFITKSQDEIDKEARTEKNRVKKAKKKERKRLEKERQKALE